jgi:glycerate 2-kinase
MKILIATDSFKDCLPAFDVSNYIAKGLKSASSLFDIRILPMADGGEGTVDSLVNANNGVLIACEVKDALLRERKALYGILGDKKTAVIEMAAASGIEHLTISERNPWYTSSYGTGQLIKHALDNGCRKIIIGIGGSATIDGGVGMAMALGVKFLNKKGEQIAFGGGAIAELNQIDLSEIDNRLAQTDIMVACDVINPLFGLEGASYVFGKQKGADIEMIKKLDRNLSHLAKVVKETLNIEIVDIPGAGAAGGLGAGIMAFCNGKLESGFNIVARETRLESFCEWAEIIITGEGKIDAQTKYGKTPQGVANMAKKYNKPVIGVAGSLVDGYTDLYESGFNALFSILDKPMDLDQAIANAPELLEKFGKSIGHLLLLQK